MEKNTLFHKDFAWHLFLFLCSTLFILITSDIALADTTADNNAIAGPICKLIGLIKGPVGKGVATLAIFAVGAGMLFGKVQTPTVVIVVVAVGVVFTADKIVNVISSDTGDNCPASAS